MYTYVFCFLYIENKFILTINDKKYRTKKTTLAIVRLTTTTLADIFSLAVVVCCHV